MGDSLSHLDDLLHYSYSMQKTPFKKDQIFEKCDHFDY